MVQHNFALGENYLVQIKHILLSRKHIDTLPWLLSVLSLLFGDVKDIQ